MLSATPLRMSYWLIPANPVRREFKRIISELAKEFDGPSFEPHLTLYSGPFGPGDYTDSIVRQTVETTGALELEVSGINFSALFTKACFVQFKPSTAATRLSDSIRNAVSCPSDYVFDPHLSLFYGELSQEAQSKILKSIKLPALAQFDEIAAIANATSVQSPADLESWREDYRLRLRGC